MSRLYLQLRRRHLLLRLLRSGAFVPGQLQVYHGYAYEQVQNLLGVGRQVGR